MKDSITSLKESGIVPSDDDHLCFISENEWSEEKNIVDSSKFELLILENFIQSRQKH